MAACGDNLQLPVEGSVVDVTVASAGIPTQGAFIVFSDPDGVTIATATTDADGYASAQVPPHTGVTAEFADPDPFPQLPSSRNWVRIRSVLDTQPGDHVVIEGPRRYWGVTFTWPEGPAGTVRYWLNSTCWPSFAIHDRTVTTSVTSLCRFGFDLVIVAEDDADNILGYNERHDLVFDDGAVIAMQPSFTTGIEVSTTDQIQVRLVGGTIPPGAFETFATRTDPGNAVFSNAPTADRVVYGAAIAVAVDADDTASSAILRPGRGDEASFVPDDGLTFLPVVRQPWLDLSTQQVGFLDTIDDQVGVIVVSLEYGTYADPYDWSITSPLQQQVQLPQLPPDGLAPTPTQSQMLYWIETLYDSDRPYSIRELSSYFDLIHGDGNWLRVSYPASPNLSPELFARPATAR